MHLLCPEVQVDLFSRNLQSVTVLQELVSHGDREAELQVKDARLAHVLQLGASLTYLSLLEP